MSGLTLSSLTLPPQTVPDVSSKNFITLLMTAERCAKSYDQYLARHKLRTCLERFTLDDVLDVSNNPRLARIFWNAANGLANANHPNRAFEFAVILKMVIPMRWRIAQSESSSKSVRADFN